jgi:RimJ/RimL family protein N-acetyltransferase
MDAIHTISIRQLLSMEQEELRSHLLRLEPEERHARFSSSANDAFINQYVDRLELRGGAHYVLGAFIDGQLRGAAEFRINAEDARAAEVAFSVEGDFQRRGLGRALFRRLLYVARNRGVRRLCLVTEPANRPMRALAQQYGMHFQAGSDAEGSLTLLPATAFSLIEELMEENLAWTQERLQLMQGRFVSLAHSPRPEPTHQRLR